MRSRFPVTSALACWPACVGAVAALLAPCAQAAEVQLSIELPRFKHRPYVAVWLERDGRQHAAELAVWHEEKARKKEGKRKADKYLPDLRQWWRTGGKDLDVPIDGVTGPTRPAGVHALRFDSRADPALATLSPGSYKLRIEVSREDGGNENLSFPLQWPPAKPQQQKQSGDVEVGEVRLGISP